MPLAEALTQQIRSSRDELMASGRLLSSEQLRACYGRFRQRFSPDALASLDGRTLLETMHLHNNRDSLVYWLEFKNDEEFPATFGSIAGGSALKFGIYRRNETGTWMTGAPNDQRELSEDEAIERARQHRDELLRGAAALEQLPPAAPDDAYLRLQQSLNDEAPSVAETAWGHKYFSLLFPDRLDDYHNPDYQRYHLIRLLQVPPGARGRYVCAGRFVEIGRELGLHLNHLTAALNRLHGNPRRYWRVGTTDPAERRSYWADMRAGGYIAIGWSKLGTLTDIVETQEAKLILRSRMERTYPGRSSDIAQSTRQVFDFAARAHQDDIVLAADGAHVLGIGRIAGGYRFDPSSGFPHQRPVEWLDTDTWRLPLPEGLRTTFAEITKAPENLVEIERRLLAPHSETPEGRHLDARPQAPLHQFVARIQAILERRGQAILYGPPGTGKTYWAHVAARELAAYYAFHRRFDSLTDGERREILGDSAHAGLVRMVTFHPAYGYEDFIEGYRPALRGDQMVFEPREGIFKRLCRDAEADPDRRYFLIIDEINRGDIPRIFGELLTLLESDKRGQHVLLGTTGHPFRVPPNVHILGTMNTADRSIALLDVALRRRFGFVELMPDASALGDATLRGIPLGRWLTSLNTRIREHVGRDARNLQIGHGYLFQRGKPVDSFERFALVLRDEIIPLLQEYTYENHEALAKILGGSLVDAERQRIRDEYFEPLDEDALVRCLAEPDPDILTAPEAVAVSPEEDSSDIADADEPDSAGPGADPVVETSDPNRA